MKKEVWLLLLVLPLVLAIDVDQEISNAQQLVGKELPPSLRVVAGNERVILHMGDVEISVITQNNKIKRISKSNLKKPTLHVYASEETVAKILNAEDPGRQFLQAKARGEVNLNAVGVGKTVKFSVASFLLDFFGSKESRAPRRVVSPQSRPRRLDPSFSQSTTNESLFRPTCEEHRDCIAGHRCKGGRCLPQPNFLACESTLDCPVASKCFANRCLPQGPALSCDTTANCPMASVCLAGACISEAPDCRKDFDCEDGEVCDDRRCRLPEGCAECDGICQEGECLPHGCNDVTDCREGFECTAGYCAIRVDRSITDIINDILGIGPAEAEDPVNLDDPDPSGDPAPVDPSTPAPDPIDISECINNFKDHEDLYYLVNNVFPGKVKVYPSNSDESTWRTAAAQLILVNDLGPDTEFLDYVGVEYDYDDLSNKVVSVMLGEPGVQLIDDRRHSCILGPIDWADAVDRGRWKAYPITSQNYEMQVQIGVFMPYVEDLLNMCERARPVTPGVQISQDFELLEVPVDQSALELDCGDPESACIAYRGFSQATPCRAAEKENKRFFDTVLNHCPGMTLEIHLSGLLPTGSDFNEGNLCEVYP